ncbi:DnaJ subfamily C member 30 [Orchesella cincta]|uniref:DnaJ subfamily C member 30 n=1 Tax=Orchesella cincta TaxID=48709 RepID=A0A1D2NJT1_ORCCI|nr:DnaJ subfamily C member 30 [Orchesella cincta]
MFKFKGYLLPSSRIPLCSKVWYSSYTSNQNYYDVLGISKHSNNDEVKRAYYEQSKLYHPDKKEGSQERFREITSAYEVLGNPRLRKMYDRGLISDSNKSIYTDSHAATESDITSEEIENKSVPMGQLDEWSKMQYSKTFARDQGRKSEKRLRDRRKAIYKDSFDLQTPFWIIGSILLGIGIYLERMRSYEKRTDRKD